MRFVTRIMMELSLFLLPILGIFVGFLVTFIGGGGGAIYIPLLMFGLGFTFKEAVPISLATMIFTSFFNAVTSFYLKASHAMKISGVFFSRRISLAFFGHDMDKHRSIEMLNIF